MITRIIHDVDSFDLETLGVKTIDLDNLAVVAAKIAAQAVATSNLAYGVTVREQYTSLEALSDGDPVYLNTSGYIGQARSNASSTMHAIGVIDGDVLSGVAGQVIIHGPHESSNYDFSGFIGKLGYVSPDTTGGIETSDINSSGEIVQSVGQIINHSGILVKISDTSHKT